MCKWTISYWMSSEKKLGKKCLLFLFSLTLCLRCCVLFCLEEIIIFVFLEHSYQKKLSPKMILGYVKSISSISTSPQPYLQIAWLNNEYYFIFILTSTTSCTCFHLLQINIKKKMKKVHSHVLSI
jgi:hypothetical protein